MAEWIRCSERLPESRESVVFGDDMGMVDVGHIVEYDYDSCPVWQGYESLKIYSHKRVSKWFKLPAETKE